MKPKLKILDVFLGNQCNLECEQCDTRSDIFRKENPYDSDFNQICESITLADRFFEVETYSALGGEPLLFFDFTKKVIRFIRQTNSKSRIVFSTNGLLIPKFLDEIVDLVNECNVCIAITDHFAGFENNHLSNKINEHVSQLISKLKYPSVDGVTFFKDFIGIDSYNDDESWHRFLKNRPGFLASHDLNIAYVYNNRWVWFHQQSHFQSHYYRNENNKPKPFLTNDPTGSYFKGCCSLFCSFLHKSKIYKCAPLGTLKSFLSKENVLYDKDWEKYINYIPLDLKNCTIKDVEEFSKNKFRESSVCDMCPNTDDQYFLKSADKVLPKKSIKLQIEI